MRILGYHISDKGATNSDKEVQGCLSLVEFLLQPKSDTIRVLYDLDFSTHLLLVNLKFTAKEASVLVDTTKFHLPPYHFRYVPGKFLSIKRSTAFSYFSNASQYVKYPVENLNLNSISLAERAREVGELVQKTFTELGIDPTSLTSPSRAYEKSQVEFLYKEMLRSDNEIRKDIIDSIGLEVFGRSWEKYIERR
jgi:hypothetical protein